MSDLLQEKAAVGGRLRVLVLMPVRDDWESAGELIQRLDEAVSSGSHSLDLLLVDDASVQSCDKKAFHCRFAAVHTIRVLRLHRNLGHQRAIAVGLAYIASNLSTDAVLVMDSDGEDTSEGAMQLLQAYASRPRPVAQFAQRIRRSESWAFRIGYFVFRQLHMALTGVGMRVGNFSIIPFEYLPTLLAMPEIWIHYAASVFRSRLPVATVPIARGTRIAGASQMKFRSLVVHGLRAISVFSDVVMGRVLIGSLAVFLLVVSLLLVRFMAHPVIPEWTNYAMGLGGLLVGQAVAIAVGFIVLSNHSGAVFVPLRDYGSYVAETSVVYRLTTRSDGEEDSASSNPARRRSISQ